MKISEGLLCPFWGGGSYDSPRVRKVRCRLATKCGFWSGRLVGFCPDLRGSDGLCHKMWVMRCECRSMLLFIELATQVDLGWQDGLASSSPSLLALSNSKHWISRLVRTGNTELQQLRSANV